MGFIKKIISGIDWVLVVSAISLTLLSFSTMNSFGLDRGLSFGVRQLMWLGISFVVFCIVSCLDLSFIKKSRFLWWLYVGGVALLVSLIFLGSTSNGARSWFDFGLFSFQPSDLTKLILIMVLAKYLARRHVEIKAIKHIFITGFYFIVPFSLIFLQPDFGSALILFGIWFGMILVAGISRKHLLILFVAMLSVFMVMWLFVFKDYQKNRIRTFIDPLSDIRGTGYNAYQSVIAVGSGQLVGKGIGYGSQSRLSFLPEYETDFIFAATSEEWGFVGSVVILILFGTIILRILATSYQMNGNFELLFGVGLAVYFMTHIIINIGMNIGLMPVTGVTLPFMSYGGSHLLVEWIGLGVFMSLRRSRRNVYRDDSPDVFLR